MFADHGELRQIQVDPGQLTTLCYTQGMLVRYLILRLRTVPAGCPSLKLALSAIRFFATVSADTAEDPTIGSHESPVLSLTFLSWMLVKSAILGLE